MCAREFKLPEYVVFLNRQFKHRSSHAFGNEMEVYLTDLVYNLREMENMGYWWVSGHWLSSIYTPQYGFFSGSEGVCEMKISWDLQDS
jgi:hypothetical protein